MTIRRNNGSSGSWKPDKVRRDRMDYMKAAKGENTVIPPPPEILNAATHNQKTLRRLLLEKAAREMESVRLFEPMPIQQEFLDCTAPKRIARGSNRSGKTTIALFDVARAVTGQDPLGRYPTHGGRAVLVGKNETHIAEVFVRKLLQHGAFKIIKDLETGQWRAFRPYDPKDAERHMDARRSLPLIPQRMIKHKAYSDKKRGVVSKLVLNNDWEIIFSTANSEPIQGVELDLVMFDEEIDSERWYPEMRFRLGDNRGKFIWSATPQTGTEQLFELSEKAAELEGTQNPDIVEFLLTMESNRHFPRDQFEAFCREFENDPEEYRVRILGQFNVSSYMVYPNFSMSPELCGYRVFVPGRDEQDAIKMDESWNYWAVIDPGFQVCAVSFWAIPPKDHKFSEQRFVYDELYIRQCNAYKFAKAMEGKTAGRRFTGFIIDPSAAKMDKLGSGKSILHQYSEALEEVGVLSSNTGSGFLSANNDIPAGVTALKSWMYVRPSTGRTKLQVAIGRCPMFEWEMTHYRNKRQKERILDVPDGKNDHLMDTARYFAMQDPAWTRPPKRLFASAQYHEFLAWKKKSEETQGGGKHVFLGPGSGK